MSNFPAEDVREYDFDEMGRLLRAMPLPDHLGGGLCKQAADAIAYLWAQDGLLSKAQNEAEKLREQLVEVERPLDEQMARLNKSLIAAHAENAKLREERMDILNGAGAIVGNVTDAAAETIDALRARVAELERDAGRLDWLQAHPVMIFLGASQASWLPGFDVRAAIDAAIGRGK